MSTGHTSLHAPHKLEARGKSANSANRSPASSGVNTAPTGPGVDAAVGVAAALPVDRAHVQAGAAADAAQNRALVAREDVAAPVVQEDDVHLVGPVGLAAGARAGDELGVDGQRLPGRRARQQVQQHGQVAIARDQLLDADQRDVAAGRGQAEAGVAFVRDQHEAAALRRHEVRAGDGGVGLQVLAPQVGAGALGDHLGGVVVGAEAIALEGARRSRAGPCA